MYSQNFYIFLQYFSTKYLVLCKMIGNIGVFKKDVEIKRDVLYNEFVGEI